MCFWDSDFLFRRLDKKIYSEFADCRKEKKVCREIKTGMRIMLYFMQFELILPICNFCSKVKTQKSQTHNSNSLFKTLLKSSKPNLETIKIVIRKRTCLNLCKGL